MRRYLTILLLGLLTGLAPAREGVTVKTQATPAKVEVGQSLRYTIDLVAEPKVELDPVALDRLKLEPFEIRDVSQTNLPAEGGLQKVRYSFKLAAYQEGELKIPSLSFGYRVEGASYAVATPTDAVTVVKVPTGQADKPGEIRGPKLLEASPIPPVLYVAGAALVLFLILALRALWKMLRQPPRVRPVPALPPYEQALLELDLLTRERLPEQGRYEEFFDRLTATVRTYLSWRYSVPMLERTSSEILADFRHRDALPHDSLTNLRDVLEQADLVKFARYQPGPEDCLARLQMARELVEFARPAQPEEVAKPESRELVGGRR